MGRKGKWFSSVKNAFSPDSKGKKNKKSQKKWFGKEKDLGSDSAPLETVKTPPHQPPPPDPKDVNLTVTENELANHAATEAVAPAVSTNAVAAAADQVVTDVRVTTKTQFLGKSGEEAAAIRIQKAFRGYLARRALRALRGLVRLKLLMEGPVVKRQASNTLRCMQTLSRIQSQIRSRRIRMFEENQAIQRQLLQKHAKELSTQMGDEWDDSLWSKEQIEANLLSKYEAAMRRERAMAYSFSHQQTLKNSSKSSNPMFMDPRNPSWGWSWLERWMAARPWEGHSTTDKEPNNDQSPVKSENRCIVGEITKSYARYQLNSDKNCLTTNQKINQTPKLQSSSTPKPQPASSTVAKKSKPASPRGSISGLDDDSRSMISMQSDGRYRRHSIPGSLARDDESLPSSTAAPRYMVPTQSAKAKSRLQSPLSADKNGTPEKASSVSAKKRLSYPPSPAKPRRHSGLPKLDTSVTTEVSVTNGSS